MGHGWVGGGRVQKQFKSPPKKGYEVGGIQPFDRMIVEGGCVRGFLSARGLGVLGRGLFVVMGVEAQSTVFFVAWVATQRKKKNTAFLHHFKDLFLTALAIIGGEVERF